MFSGIVEPAIAAAMEVSVAVGAGVACANAVGGGSDLDLIAAFPTREQ